jgi:hypothetical protein
MAFFKNYHRGHSKIRKNNKAIGIILFFLIHRGYLKSKPPPPDASVRGLPCIQALR